MTEHVESAAFREAARKNSLYLTGYPSICVYAKSIPTMTELRLATFKTSSPTGAVSQLFSALANIQTQIESIREGVKMQDSKDVPGVAYSDIEGMTLQLSGDVYFTSKKDYENFVSNVGTLVTNNGWVVNNGGGGVRVYHAANTSAYNSDPVMSAIKGMVLSQISQEMDMIDIWATDQETEDVQEQKDFMMARARIDSMSPFRSAAIQYHSNKPSGVHAYWSQAPKLVLQVDGETVYTTNIGYFPTSFTSTPHAFVLDSSNEFYPTKCEITMGLSNVLGGLISSHVDGSEKGDSVPKDVTRITESALGL